MKKMKRTLAAILTIVMVSACVPAALAVTPDYVTRGEVADLLLAAADDYNPDVKRSDILKGYADGQTHEERNVTRAQALVMLQRAFGTLPTPQGDNARSGYGATNFTDVPAWSKTELANVFQSGIVAGTTATTFSPNAYVTEHQMELFITRTYALEGTNLKDDFYATVNKTALDSSVIQPGYMGAGSFNDLGVSVDQNVAALIKEAASNPKTAGEQKLSNFYHNILNKDARNKAGITPIQPYLTAIDAASSVSDLINVQNDVYENLGANLLMGFGLTVDDKDSNSHMLTFSAISPALGQSGYDSASASQKSAYIAYLTTLGKLLGKSDADAAKDAQLIWNADSALAKASLTNQELGDVDKTYNIYTLAQLQAMFPNVDLTAVFEKSGYTQTDRIMVSDVGKLKAAAALFDGAHLDTLKAYCRLAMASGYGDFLNEEFTEAGNDFSSAYLGMDSKISDEDLAAQYVQALMEDYLGEAYVSKYFSSKAKADVESMVKDIIAVYKERINSLTWMSSTTKAKAIRKLDTMKLHMGYPDQWDDDLKDTKILSASEGGSFLSNVVAMNKAYHQKAVAEQKNSVDKTAWSMSVYTVNACYNPVVNSIEFPAGILQAPFYDVNASYEKNLGSIGYVIAHEITHAFDNNGAKYDENGNATDWWTAEDYAAFGTLCQQVVDLYDGQEAAPGITCNGALTLSENIADLGSMACITELESRRTNPDYKALYTAAAEIWCSSYSRDTKIYWAQVDVHAPDKLRGSLVLRQFQPFYDAFGIQEGDGMWIAPENRVTIW
ncbi:MAG: S-layer homology domain-containing protein [Oscillibacter sp.]|jgi:putative endopeptidase|nr:S-layer homology domain-containing protein [Oscillibacter sp.]